MTSSNHVTTTTTTEEAEEDATDNLFPVDFEVFQAKYQYDASQISPNDNPDSELSFAVGDYLFIYGEPEEVGERVVEWWCGGVVEWWNGDNDNDDNDDDNNVDANDNDDDDNDNDDDGDDDDDTGGRTDFTGGSRWTARRAMCRQTSFRKCQVRGCLCLLFVCFVVVVCSWLLFVRGCCLFVVVCLFVHGCLFVRGCCLLLVFVF